MTRILGITRAPQYSPQLEAQDMAILKAVMERMEGEKRMVNETEVDDDFAANIILSMGRQPLTVKWLKDKEAEGVLVVNSGYGVEACQRSHVDKIMRSHGVPMPPTTGMHGYWLKRGDASAQTRDDVVYCRNDKELAQAKSAFRNRGITDMVVSANMQGDVVKFYGVRKTAFFRCFYPGDDGISKFGNAARNGVPLHYAFSVERLQCDAERLAGLLHTEVYGGDCIVASDGTYSIIDFNDWPSFSRCREEAAEAIANKVQADWERRKKQDNESIQRAITGLF